MSGMPLFQALLFLALASVIVFAAQPRHFHPFIAIVVIATVFGFAAGLPIAVIGNDFGTGFSQTLYSPGLVIVGAAFIASLAESTTISDRLAAAINHWRGRGSAALAALLGLVAGIGASPASSFALLIPLLPAVSGENAPTRKTARIALALSISACHGLIWLSPVPIAATAILGADWSRVALFGLPVAILSIAIGAAWARCLPSDSASQSATTSSPAPTEKQTGGSSIVLLLATAIPLLMLMVQSLGYMPSEPLGGGPTRGMILALGQPLFLFLTGVGIMIVGHWRQHVRLLTEPAWTGRILANVSGVLLSVGAAGGLQKLCQDTGMAELLGERLTGWQAGAIGGVLIPFLVAATVKTLQGSSLVAAITAAGMVQPLLAPLGMGGANTTALAALAIGAGAMTVSHVNDGYFWLVADTAGLSPTRAIAAVTAGMLLQGIVVLAALLALAVLVGSP